MATDAVSVIREAYGAYAAGDVDTLLGYVDPELEWTYLDPAEEDPPPRVCHGRRELEVALRRQLGQGLTAQLEETVGNGDEVMVVVRIPGVDALRARKADDRNFDVMTVKDGRIVAIRACHNRAEARSVAGLSEEQVP